KVAPWPLAIAFVLVVMLGTAYFVFGRGSHAPRAVEEQVPPPMAKATPDAVPATAARASPSPVVAPPATARAPFSAGLMLRQVLEGSDPRHTVNANAETAQVRIGQDAVRFSVSSSRPGYLYVLALAGGDADLELLFPNALDADNRLAEGQPR